MMWRGMTAMPAIKHFLNVRLLTYMPFYDVESEMRQALRCGGCR
jgi:hypothetical protein